LAGEDGDDEIRALGGSELIFGGSGNDIIYGGPGDDAYLTGSEGKDVIYGGPGDDTKLDEAGDGQRDKVYCGEGRDSYWADKVDYVSSSCEVKLPNSLRGPDKVPKGGIP